MINPHRKEKLVSDRIWHRADIMAEVRKRGTTLAALAHDEGLARQTLYWAMHSQPRLRANKLIADFLGVPLHELWPNWFDSHGNLIPPDKRKAGPVGAGPRPDSITRGAHPARATARKRARAA